MVEERLMIRGLKPYAGKLARTVSRGGRPVMVTVLSEMTSPTREEGVKYNNVVKYH